MDDTISRRAAIDALSHCQTYLFDSRDDDEKISLEDAEYAIEQLPSAQPEIIYCKDCKWKQGAKCVRFADVRPFPSDFCSRAERREDERTD